MDDTHEPEIEVIDVTDAVDLADAEAEVDLVMMELLRAHVPLSLLVDLAYPEGPHSREILAAEAG